jgi:drug/metabolite transporter (DMT)-like permease
VGWAVFTGLIIASYSLVDRRGVDYMEPLPYVSLLGAGACTLLIPVVVNKREALRAEWRAGYRSIVVAALFSLSGYVLVLHAMRLSNTSYVVASRELSIVMSVVVGRLFLGERPTPARFAGAGIIVAGVFFLAFAR